MTRARDLLTGDLFSQIPTPAPTAPGAMSYAREIAHVMSKALKECSYERPFVAARMTELLGYEQTLHVLNKYTAESDESRHITLERAIAFDAATESYALLNFFAAKRGCRVAVGKDVLLAELGRIKQTRDQLASQEKAIREYLREGK